MIMVETFTVAQTRVRSFLYVIERPDTGALKVGFTTRPHYRARFHAIQSSNDVDLRLLLFVRVPLGTEARIHAALAPWKKRGEWFNPSPEVTDWLKRQMECCASSRHRGTYFIAA